MQIISKQASELGLPPGRYPAQLETNTGNGQPFVFTTFTPSGAAVYRQANGCVMLHVLND